MSLELNWRNYINDHAVDITQVKEGQKYYIINDVTNPSNTECGIVVTLNDGTEYATGRGLAVKYESTGQYVDLFPGGDIDDRNTETSTHQKLYNVKYLKNGGNRKSRRNRKNKSKSKKSKSRKNTRGGRC